MKIPIINPTTTLIELTWLTTKYTSGTSLSVKDSTGFADNDIILVGQPGQERSEVTDITASVSSKTALTVTALDFAHGKDAPVYRVMYDKAIIERSIDGGTTYAALATVDLTYDKLITVYDDTSGAATYYYRVKFQNSASSAVTDYSAAQIGSGWPRGSVGRMVRNVRRNLGDLAHRTIEDWEIMESLKEASDDILAEIPNANWTKRTSTKNTVADQFDDYDLPSRYRAMEMLMYRNTVSATDDKEYPLHYTPKDVFMHQHSDKTEDSDDDLDLWTELPGDSDFPNGYLGIYPTPATSDKVMTLHYFEADPAFDDYADTTSCPLPQVLEYYATYTLAKDQDTINKYEKLYKRGLLNLRGMQRRNFEPKELRRWHGRDGVSNLYGFGSHRKSNSDVENYW